MKPEAGARFTIGLETRWSKTDGYCLLYLNGQHEYAFNGPTMFQGAEGVYFKWGVYSNTWRLEDSSRHLYQLVPVLNDAKYTTQQGGEAYIQSEIVDDDFVHNFYETVNNPRAEFKRSDNHVENETTFVERTIILPDDWQSVEDATVIMQYHAWPDNVGGGPNVAVSIYGEHNDKPGKGARVMLVVKNDNGSATHRMYEV